MLDSPRGGGGGEERGATTHIAQWTKYPSLIVIFPNKKRQMLTDTVYLLMIHHVCQI